MTAAAITLVALSIGGYIVVGGLVYQVLREAWEDYVDAAVAAWLWPFTLTVALVVATARVLWLVAIRFLWVSLPSAIMTRVRRRKVPVAKVVRR